MPSRKEENGEAVNRAEVTWAAKVPGGLEPSWRSGSVVAEASADEPQERQLRFGDRVGI